MQRLERAQKHDLAAILAAHVDEGIQRSQGGRADPAVGRKIGIVASSAIERGQRSLEEGHRDGRTHIRSGIEQFGRDRRSVVGIVFVNEVLVDERARGVEPFMRAPLIIPARESASNALIQMRQAKAAMAVVTDPRRGFVGIITLKDIVEEIFGELSAW